MEANNRDIETAGMDHHENARERIINKDPAVTKYLAHIGLHGERGSTAAHRAALVTRLEDANVLQMATTQHRDASEKHRKWPSALTSHAVNGVIGHHGLSVTGCVEMAEGTVNATAKEIIHVAAMESRRK